MKPARLVLILILGALGFFVALWINRGATQRDAEASLRRCGPPPSEQARMEAYEQCLLTIRNRMDHETAEQSR